MTVEEFTAALGDLETRVDRLRALYENWFRGYEKLEPAVARKDVERRVYGLRKELPRNTALRFRYNQLYQRYTTLATYWQRTARQIEEGTYRRQLQRIKRRREDEQSRSMAPSSREGESSQPPNEFELNLDETLDVRNLLDDFDLDQVASALEVSRPVQSPPPKIAAELAANVRTAASMSLPSMSAPSVAALGRTADAPPAAKAPEPAARAVGRFARPSASAGNGTVGVGPTRAGSQRPPALAPANDVTAPTAAGHPPGFPSPARAPGALPMPPVLGRGTGSMPMPPAPSGRGTGSVPMPPPPSARASLPGPILSRAPGAPPAFTPSVKPAAPPPAAPPAPPNAASSSVRSAQPAIPARAAPPTVTASVAGPPAGARPPQSTGPAQVPPRVSVQAPAARPAQPSAPQPTAARVEGLDEQRMRRIYEEYTAAKRKNNEGEVRFETLAGSIQKMLPDLSKKHAGKQIDFEVVLKDGRVGLKPKAT
jgi:hypothetical protein